MASMHRAAFCYRFGLLRAYSVQTCDVAKVPRASNLWHDRSFASPSIRSSFRTVAAGSADQSIMFWFVDQEEPAHETKDAHSGMVSGVRWHPLGHLLCSIGSDAALKLWTRERPGDMLLGSLATGTIGQNQEVDATPPTIMPNGEGSSKAAIPGLNLGSKRPTPPPAPHMSTPGLPPAGAGPPHPPPPAPSMPVAPPRPHFAPRPPAGPPGHGPIRPERPQWPSQGPVGPPQGPSGFIHPQHMWPVNTRAGGPGMLPPGAQQRPMQGMQPHGDGRGMHDWGGPGRGRGRGGWGPNSYGRGQGQWGN